MKKLRYFLEYIFVKTWLFIVESLPLEIASNMGSKVFQVIGKKLKATRTARTNLKKTFPNLNHQEIEKIIDGVWDNFVRVVAETSTIM